MGEQAKTLAEYMAELETRGLPTFQSKLIYHPFDNRIEYYAKDKAFYVEQIDANFRICKAFDTNEVIGFKFYLAKGTKVVEEVAEQSKP